VLGVKDSKEKEKRNRKDKGIRKKRITWVLGTNIYAHTTKKNQKTKQKKRQKEDKRGQKQGHSY
jgi:hypothetical protein